MHSHTIKYSYFIGCLSDNPTGCIEQVSCKVINVRSGAELPEKCRELALHFETQGTPIMIGELDK